MEHPPFSGPHSNVALDPSYVAAIRRLAALDPCRLACPEDDTTPAVGNPPCFPPANQHG